MLNIVRDDTQLVERYRTIIDKIHGGRAQWIEGTLELAVFMREARIDYPDHSAFSRWLECNGLQVVSKDNRTALLWMADNLVEARELLTQTTFKSWDSIYRTRPNRALRKNTKGTKSHPSGAAGRKRAKRIPDVMQDDYVPPERTGGFKLKALTREQVDPDFKGTPLEFATKYGHVNLHTKDEIEYHKQQEALSAWLSAVNDFYHSATVVVSKLNMLDTATLREWKAKPGKAAKLQAWRDYCELACKKLENI